MWLHTTDTDAELREAVDLLKPTQDIVASFPLYHHILHGVKRHFSLSEAHRLCLVSARCKRGYGSVDAYACPHIVEFGVKERHQLLLFDNR